MTTAIKTFAIPAVLAGNFAAWGWAIHTGAALDGVVFASFMVSLVVLQALELAFPFRREWANSGKEWMRDLLYFGMNGGVDAAAKALAVAAVLALVPGGNGLPLWADIIVAVLVADFFGYWLHRWGHVGWLWKVHGVHHTPDKVNLMNNNTVNFLNIFLGTLVKAVPLGLLGVSPEAAAVAVAFVSLQSFVVHVNADLSVPFGLERFLMTPAHHRLHHSTVLEEAGNYASALTLWDATFGTLVYEPGLVPEEVGVVDPATFPAPTDVIANQLHPFRRIERYGEPDAEQIRAA